MGMTEPVTATEAEAEQVTKEKLMEDLRAVVADAEELLKATANQTGERIAAARAKAEESLKAAKARLAKEKAAVMAKTKAAAQGHRRLRAGQSLEGRGNHRGGWLRPRHPGRTPLTRVYGLWSAESRHRSPYICYKSGFKAEQLPEGLSRVERILR